MSNKFTQKAQNTLNHALNIAREMGHTYIGSEHILLGLLSEGDSIASRLLVTRGADAKKIRNTVIDISGIGSRSQVTPADMTPRAKKVIEASAAEALRCGNHYIGTEHILYALLAERDCVAVRLLESEGIPASEVIGDLNAYICASAGRSEKQGSKSESKSGADDRLRITPRTNLFARADPDPCMERRSGSARPHHRCEHHPPTFQNRCIRLVYSNPFRFWLWLPRLNFHSIDGSS